MATSHSVATPLEVGIRYSRHQLDNLQSSKQHLMDKIPYNQAIGSLQYLVTCTHWGLTFSANHLAQFMHEPTPAHWLSIKSIFRYVRGTSKQSLGYSSLPSAPTSLHQLTGWSDADWAGDIDTYRSTLGYIFQLDSSYLLSWQSRKQTIVALSSMEAEYIAAATATKELLWFQVLGRTWLLSDFPWNHLL